MYYRVILVSKEKKETLVVEALSKREASQKAKIGKDGYIAVSVKEKSMPIGRLLANITGWTMRIFCSRIPIDQKISTVSQIAVMSDAGIPIHDILTEISQNIENRRLKEIYGNIATDINAGKSMSEAMGMYRNELGDIVLVMTKLGESTGDISSAYSKLVIILEDIRDNVHRFKKAIRSPMVTLVAIAIAFSVLIIYVVPAFSSIFAKLGAQLPIATKILLATEHIFSSYGIYILLCLVLALYIFRYAYNGANEFRYKVDKFVIHPKVYLLSKVVFLSNMQRYMLVLSELVKSGIPVADALSTAVDMVSNLYIKRKLIGVNSSISRGMGLGDAFAQTGLFENMLLQMIYAGESSGELDRMLEKVRGYYAMRFESIVENMSAYIEPIMLLFIASLVLLMALGVFMPMWDLGRVVSG